MLPLEEVAVAVEEIVQSLGYDDLDVDHPVRMYLDYVRQTWTNADATNPPHIVSHPLPLMRLLQVNLMKHQKKQQRASRGGREMEGLEAGNVVVCLRRLTSGSSSKASRTADTHTHAHSFASE